MKNQKSFIVMPLLLPFILSSLTAPAAAKDGPSSEIPARREFPLDTSKNPCTDFHAYVCTKAEASFKLRPDRSSHTFSFNDSRERILEAKKKYMKDIPTKKNLDERTEQVRDYYMACMNAKASAKAERDEVATRLKAVSELKTKDDFIKYIHNNMPTALGKFFYLWPTSNLDDPHKLDVILGADFMELPDHKYYENAALMKDYRTLLANFFQAVYGKKLKKPEAERKADAYIDFQKEFIKTYPQAAVRRQRWSERRISTQAEIQKKYPNIKAEMIFSDVPKTTLVNTIIPESLEFFNNNFEKYSLELWKDIYLYKNLHDIMDDAYPKTFQEAFDFEKKYLGGPEVRSVRQERCTKEAGDHFMKELDAVLMDQLFPNFDEAKVQATAGAIRESILRGLEKNTWLSKEAKKGAMEKIKKARLYLVKPHNDKEWDFNLVGKYSPTNPISNEHTYNGLRWGKNMKDLKEPANMEAWGMGPLTVNAYYSESENKFVVPMGILQYPFFDSKMELYENIGAIGTVMGHELGHSIDDNGSKYDADGKLSNWMPMHDVAEFNKRSGRLVELFNKARHDGALTLGENVADLVGLTFAYDASFPNGKPTQEEKQKFFIAYARSWCYVARPDFDAMMRKTDPHAAGWARINEQVKHQPAFAEAFHCKPGDAMTLPENERVKIW